MVRGNSQHAAASSKRIWLIVIAGLAVLALLGTAVWSGQRGSDDEQSTADSHANDSEANGSQDGGSGGGSDSGDQHADQGQSGKQGSGKEKSGHEESGHEKSGKAGSGKAGSGKAKSRSTDSGLERRQRGDTLALGDADAPVVMIEYADYRCPFCALFSRDTLPKLKKEYIDTGKVRYEWRDMPIYGDQSVQAAVAARAAGKQDKFWDFHNAIYEAAPEHGHPKFNQAKLVRFAKKVDVPDIGKFKHDLDSKKLKQLVQADAEEGQSIGASATPSFVIGQTAVPGAQPIKAFRKVIDKELKKADK